MGTLSNWLAPSNNGRMKAARLPHPVAARQDPLLCWLRTLGDGSLERSAVRREVVVVEKREVAQVVLPEGGVCKRRRELVPYCPGARRSVPDL